MNLLILYSEEFGEKVIGNLVNAPKFCQSCGLLCIHCKEGKYSYATNIVGVIEFPNTNTMPIFIENPDVYLPMELPSADLVITTGIHQDILLELPIKLNEAGIGGLIAPIERPKEISLGLKRQIEEKCHELGIECVFPKPFCSLVSKVDKPLIAKFMKEFKIGKPSLKIKTKKLGKKVVISSASVERSAPCGSTWFVARNIVGAEINNRRELWNRISMAHHSYPCTASMERDEKIGDTILHKAGYLIREAVEEALDEKTRYTMAKGDAGFHLK